MSDSVPSMTCEVCGERRPWVDIDVCSHDMSEIFDLDPDTMFRNVRYCADNPACEAAAKDYSRWEIKLDDDEDRVPDGTEVCIETFKAHYTAKKSTGGWVVWRHGIVDGKRDQFAVMVGTWPYLRHARVSLGVRDVSEQE